MKPEEAAGLVGKPVKVRRQKGVPGYHHGRLEAVTKDEALVSLAGHGHTAWIPLTHIKRWAKGEALAEAHAHR